jgi:hypothetical protein
MFHVSMAFAVYVGFARLNACGVFMADAVSEFEWLRRFWVSVDGCLL